ncbi:MAG: rhomboid family intramembrane serine protease [Marinilabiliales bacterium]|nr:MAG: rhomboid family intramembrane serine protease [Marinilabiliales bacterium]
MQGFNQYRNSPVDILKQIFLSPSIISRLILINTAVYLLIKIVGTFAWLFTGDSSAVISPLGEFLALPSDMGSLLTHPWTLFTYMFLHEGFFHLFFNMILLYFGGLIFQEYLSSSKLLWTYLLGGLAGAVFFILAFNIFPVFDGVKSEAVALGASASVLAIVIAISTYVPDYTVHLFLFGKLKLKYLALIMILIDVLSIQSANAGGHIAHLGGALWGFLYAFYLRRGNDLYGSLYGIKIPKFKWSSKSKAAKFTTSRPDSGRPLNDDEYNKRKVYNQEEIDRILDKISRSGYSSLTKEEKQMLFNNSNKN